MKYTKNTRYYQFSRKLRAGKRIQLKEHFVYKDLCLFQSLQFNEQNDFAVFLRLPKHTNLLLEYGKSLQNSTLKQVSDKFK